MNSPEFQPQRLSFESQAPEQGLSLRDHLRILNKRRLTVATVFIIVFIFSIIMGMKEETPRYTSTATILMERNLMNTNTGLGMYHVWDPEFLPTQTEIIKSKKVSRRVVEQLELDVKYYSHFFPTTKKKVSWITRLKNLPRQFFGETDSSPSVSGTEQPVQSEETRKKTSDIIADIIRYGIEVEPIKETRVVNIHYTDTNPALAKLINDAILQAYIDETLDIKLNSTQQSLRWMTSKAEQERTKLEEAERNLQKYMREHNLVTLENRLAVYPEKLSQFSTQLSSAQSARKSLEDVQNQITRPDSTEKALESLPLFAQDQRLQSLREQILKSEQLIKELSKKYGPKHPRMIKAMDDRDILVREKSLEIKRIIDSISKEYELAKSQEENLKELLNSTKTELMDVNERFIQYSIMKREVDSSRALYEALTSTLKKASVTEESQNVNIWIMREASLPKSPSNQKPKRTLTIGLILALASGIAMALLVEYLDNTIKNPDDIENRFHLTVLGNIFETQKSQTIEKVINENGQSPISESYRMIRSSLLLSSADHPPRTILLTSMKPQEGKTSTTLNLARTLAQISSKVLIIDADMRRPRIHKILGVPSTIGLSSYLSGNIDELIIQANPGENILIKEPENEIIHLLPAGPVPPNPVELISSQRMKDLLDEMRVKYDYVLIDSPPIINLADALILSTLTEGTIIVSRAGKTTYDFFGAGLKKLKEMHPRILGVILNAVSTRNFDKNTYYNYYEYYSDDPADKGQA